MEGKVTMSTKYTQMRMVVTPDFRVDRKKLTFCTHYYPDANPPTQCPARYHQITARRSWFDWLMIFLCNGPSGIREFKADDLQAERCHLFDGHWEFPNQRMHMNGHGDRWPVTAADTVRLNPDE